MPAQTPVDATGAIGIGGLGDCTPVAGTTAALTTAPLHGTVALVPFSGTHPGCPSGTIFTGWQATYTWTDTVGMPGSGSDYFRVTFNDAQGNQPMISDVVIFLNTNPKAGCTDLKPTCSCAPGSNKPASPKDPAPTASNAGQVFAGDPIDIGSGNISYHVTDYQTAGQNPLAFIRTYNSNASITGFAQLIGSNWRSNYDRYVDILSPYTVNVERANGQILAFYLNGSRWTADTDVDVSLSQSGNTWTLTDENDTVETYTAKILPAPGFTITSPNAAQLTSIRYRNGYTQQLAYNGNQLASVTDTYGRALNFTYANGVLATLTTPDNTTISYAHAAVPLADIAPPLRIILNNNVLTGVTYSGNPSSTQTYLYENASLPFALTGVVDENGNRYATWTYDSQGRGLTNQLGAGANLTTVSYDDTTGDRTVTNALGQQEVFHFSTLQDIAKVSEIDRTASSTTAAATMLFTYDGNGYLASQTDWNGNKTTFTNNSHGLPTAVNEAVGSSAARTTTIAYDAKWVHLPASLATVGLTASFTYDAQGEQLTATLTDTTTETVPYATKGQVRTQTYTYGNSLVTSIATPNGTTTNLAYDGTGALTSVTDALAHTTSVTAHTGGGLPETIVDPNGVKTTLTYDARQRLLSSTITTSAGPVTTSLVYDFAGNLTSTRLPDGATLSNSYDSAHRLTGITDLFKQTINYSLDALGDRTQTLVLNAAGATQRQHSGSFDALGRLSNDVGGVGQTTTLVYDANGNALMVTDPLSRVTKRTFDALNRPTTITDPVSGVTTIAYDTHDRPLTVTDPNGNATKYTYDGFGDLIQQVSPDNGTSVFRYDADGNRVQSVDARNVVANYGFDALDRLRAVTYPRASGENVIYNYDEAGHGFGIGRLTSMLDAAGALSRSYDERGNLLKDARSIAALPSRYRRPGGPAPSSPPSLVTSYTYDPASRVASITYTSGVIVGYSRDAMGRVIGVTAQPPGSSAPMSVLSKIGYNPFGPLSALTFGNGINETRSFDLDYRLTTLAATGSRTVQNLTYAYNNANDVVSIADGVTPASSQSFGYDPLDRLTSATGAYGAFGWMYDKNGNRLTQTLADVATNYTYTAGTNRLASIASGGVTSPVSYVASGNISGITVPGSPTIASTYNQANRLASVATPAQSAEYTYDGFGQRLEKRLPSSPSIIYQYGQGGTLLEETNIGATENYVYLGGRPIAEWSSATGKLSFLHDDRLGTPQLGTDGSQNINWSAQYQPFGATGTSVTGSLTQNLRFPGQYFDAEMGWRQNGFRNYVPEIGRYIETDPFGLGGGLNTYAYVKANPVNAVDPWGLLMTLPPTTAVASTLPPAGPLNFQPSQADASSLLPSSPLLPSSTSKNTCSSTSNSESSPMVLAGDVIPFPIGPLGCDQALNLCKQGGHNSFACLRAWAQCKQGLGPVTFPSGHVGSE